MIGLLGASGKIGTEIAAALKLLMPEIKIKSGCRRYIENSYTDAYQFVDANSLQLLKDFATDCKLIINASGVVIKNNIGIPVIDVGDDDYYKSLKYQQMSFIYGCGAVPGVIGLIPQKLAEEFDSIKKLQVNYIINEPLTMTAAFDMTKSFHINSSKSPAPKIKNQPEKIPFIGDSAYRYRFVDTESKIIDSLLEVTDSKWFMVRDSDDFEQLFAESYNSRKELAEQIFKLSHIKQLGNTNSISFVIEISGIKDTAEKVISCHAKSFSPSGLSGKVCAAVAVALYDMKISSGVYRMSSCQEWKEIWKLIEKLNAFDVFVTYPYALEYMEQEEEGEI